LYINEFGFSIDSELSDIVSKTNYVLDIFEEANRGMTTGIRYNAENNRLCSYYL
jgi:hypothetical protein